MMVLLGAAASAALPAALVAPPCVACRAEIEQFRRGYSDRDWTALTRGSIVTADKTEEDAMGTKHGAVEATALIHTTPDRVWAVLADFESRPQYMPTIKEVHISRVDGNRVWVTQRLRMFLIGIRYGVINTLQPELGSISWVLDD